MLMAKSSAETGLGHPGHPSQPVCPGYLGQTRFKNYPGLTQIRSRHTQN